MKVIFLFVLCFSFSFAPAQSLMKPGDKTEGEAYQIEQRKRFFIESRGLEEVANPLFLRKKAVDLLKKQMKTKSDNIPSSWVSVGPSPMTMLNWRMGMVAGRISCLAIDDEAPNIMYLGAASGGIWKSYDAGLSWTAIGDQIGTQTIGSITIDPHNHERIWVGTGEHATYCSKYFGLGLFRSDDGGLSFQEVNGSGSQTLDLSFISSIHINRENLDVILVGGHGYCSGANYLSGGLFRSTDGGNSWTRQKSATVNDILQDPSNSDVLYTSLGSYGGSDTGIYRSSNAGETWNRLSGGLPSSQTIRRSRIALSYYNPNHLYALINRNDGSTELYRSMDAGQSWVMVNPESCEGQCSYNLCLAVHPDDPDIVMVGTIRFAMSIDGGYSLTPMTDRWGRLQAVHQDTHVIQWSYLDSDTIWIGTDGGLWGTTDMGATFNNHNSGLNITQFYDLAVHPTNAEIIFGGAQDNSSLKTRGNTIWNVTLVTGDGFMNLIDPQHPENIFQTSYPYDDLPNIFLSKNGGGSFRSVSVNGLTQGDPWGWKTPMEIAEPITSNHKTPVFVGSNKVYRTLDYGSNWLQISDVLSTDESKPISVMSAKTINAKTVMYVGTYKGDIFRTDDATANHVTWTQVTANYPGGLPSDFAIGPGNPLHVYVTSGVITGDHLFASQNGGESWQKVGSGLPAIPANTVCIDPKSPNRIFVGTDIGVFISEDHGEHFVPFMDGMPLGNVIVDMEIDDSPYVLTAATYGRGAWQIELPELKTLPIPGFYERHSGQVTEVSQTETTLFLTNPYSEEITFEVSSLDAKGKVHSVRDLVLPPRGSVHSVVESSAGTLSGGHARLFGSRLPLVALIKEDTSRLAGLYHPELPLSEEIVVSHVARDRDLFFTGFSLVSDRDTDVSWVTPDSETSSFSLTQGESRKMELDLLLGPGSHVPAFGYFKTDNGANIAGTQSFGYWNGWERAALLPLGSYGTKHLIFPHVAADTQAFWTGLVALNATLEGARVTVRFWGQQGDLKQEQAIVIPAGEKQVMLFDNLENTVESTIPMQAFPEQTGWVELLSDQDLHGFELFGNSDPGSDFLEGIRAADQPLDHAVAPYIHHGENKWFGVALVNPGEVNSEILLVLRDLEGLFVGAYVFGLPAHAKTTKVLTDLFSAEEIALASSLWVETTSGDGVIGMALFGDVNSPRLKLGGYELIPVSTEKLGVFNP